MCTAYTARGYCKVQVEIRWAWVRVITVEIAQLSVNLRYILEAESIALRFKLEYGGWRRGKKQEWLLDFQLKSKDQNLVSWQLVLASSCHWREPSRWLQSVCPFLLHITRMQNKLDHLLFPHRPWPLLPSCCYTSCSLHQNSLLHLPWFKSDPHLRAH